MKRLESLITVLTLLLMGYVAWRVTPHKAPKVVTLTGLQYEPSIGRIDAPYTVVLFSDYRCPYCQKAEAGIVQDIKMLAEAGKVRYIFQDFPLPMHPDAEKLAEAGRCGWATGTFWGMQSGLFEKDSVVPTKLKACVTSGAQKVNVEASVNRGKTIGVESTPTFIVGKTVPGGVTGKLYIGIGTFDLKELK